MGCNANDDEKPVHEVRIAYPLAVGKYAVTFEECDRYAAEVKGAHQPSDEGWGRGRRPVINVNFHDAESYCEWLSKKTGQSYRLLSEAEWEYACRAGTTTEYYWGNSEAGIDNYAVYPCNSNNKTAEVGSKRPNPWGLYDMSGNVLEWVEDCYHDSYKGAPTDGSVWQGDGANRVLRGGSWNISPGYSRSAHRYNGTPACRINCIGFRLARMLP